MGWKGPMQHVKFKTRLYRPDEGRDLWEQLNHLNHLMCHKNFQDVFYCKNE